ncbi:Flagellar hook-associated protein 1 [bacterium HR40]|nr:Flagellar hook-associated protein 1 [bacterium HR40]
MSLLAALSASLTGLDAAKRNVQYAAHNAANTHTDGYSRKAVEQVQRVVDGIGMGVDASAVRRFADDYLNRELRLHRGELERARVTAQVQDRVQVLLFGRPGEASRAVPDRLSALAAALENWGNGPDTVATRTAAVAAVEDFAQAVDDAGRTLQKLRGELDRRIADTVRAINSDLRALHSVNLEIARSGATAELLDERDRLLDSLAGRIEISVAEQERGTIAVYARGGTPLLEYGAKQLFYRPAASVTADTVFDAITVYEASDIDPATGEPVSGAKGMELVSAGKVAQTNLRAGELVGLLEARDRVLPELAGQYDELAELARFALNAAHNEAWPSPLPFALAGTREDAGAAFDAATRTGTAYAAVIDRATGDTVATIAIDLSQDAGTLLAGLTTALAPFGGNASFDSDGKLQVAVDPSFGLAFTAGDGTIVETDSEGRTRSYGFAHFFGLNDLLVRSPLRATALALAPALAQDPARLGHARLDIDTSTTTATLGGAGDGRGGLGLAAAITTGYATLTRGDITGRTVDLRSYASDVASVAARKAAETERALQERSVLVDDLTARRSAVSGVNLDEELARLAIFQQSYAASARILAVVDEMLDTLIRAVE